MPTISSHSFYGIVIAMFYNDHDPPHFHARYAESRARVAIETGQLIDGDLAARAQRLVHEGAGIGVAELEQDWQLARAFEPLRPIEPLP